MAGIKVHNMVQESISSGGTGTITLGGAVTGFETFTSRLSDGDECYVMFSLGEGNFNGDANDWEVSKCTFTAAGTTLARDTVQESSNSDAAITVSASHTAYIVNPAYIMDKIEFETPTAGTTRLAGAGNDTMTGIDNYLSGVGCGILLTTGQENCAVGKDSFAVATTAFRSTYFGKDSGNKATGSDCVGVGKDCLGGTLTHTGNQLTCMGSFAGQGLTSGDGVVNIGYNCTSNGGGRRNSIIGSETVSGNNVDYTYSLGYRCTMSADVGIAIGYRITTTASRQCIFGNAAYPTEGAITDFYFNGLTAPAGTAPTLQACGGSGTNNVAKAINIASGKSTGNAIGADLNFQTSDPGASGTALQVLSTKGYVDGTDGGLVWGSPTGASQGAGTINAEGVYDDSVLLTDYIFEIYYDGKPIDDEHKDYKIKSLDEEIAFTKENKHLSTIIGRKEWEKKTASTGELINQLWATVETQFLYIQELNKRIKTLEDVG